MSSQSVPCAKGVWTKITTSSDSGVISLRSGSVTLTESTVEPVGDASNTAWSGSLTVSGDYGSYSDVASGEFIWAYGVSESVLDVTPAGGAL